MGIERYQGVVPRWESFLHSSRSQEPVTLRVHTGRIAPDVLAARLESLGFRLEPLQGLPGFLRVLEQPYPVSRTLEHWLGLCYLQQAVTGVAPLALGVKPGEPSSEIGLHVRSLSNAPGAFPE